MAKVLSESRPELSDLAPQAIKTSYLKIKEVIGKVGGTIKKVLLRKQKQILILVTTVTLVFMEEAESREARIIESMISDPEAISS